MDKLGFDITGRRFNPIWLILGALSGRAIGLYGAMDFGQWYFVANDASIGWQIFGAIAGALLCSFIMTSDVPFHTKGALLGLGIGFAIAVYGAEIYLMLNKKYLSASLSQMDAAEGIFYDWVFMHLAWLLCFVGWIVGAIIWRRKILADSGA